MGMTLHSTSKVWKWQFQLYFTASKVRPWRAIIRRTTGHNKPKPRQLAAQPDFMLFMTNQARIANRTASH